MALLPILGESNVSGCKGSALLSRFKGPCNSGIFQRAASSGTPIPRLQRYEPGRRLGERIDADELAGTEATPVGAMAKEGVPVEIVLRVGDREL